MNASSKITTFLMFSGQAEEAIRWYTSLFADSAIQHMFYQDNGKVLHSIFTLNGQTFMAIDNTSAYHAFTPAISLFVNCETTDELTRLFEALSTEGEVLMPLAASPVSQQFGWVQDRYGVNWQLNLPKKEN